MRKQALLLALIVCSFMLIGLVEAQPTFEVNANPTEGLQIYYPAFDVVKQDTNFSLHIHVSNLSNGLTLPNNVVSCYLHLYDQTGGHTFQSGVLTQDANGIDHEIDISGGNFSELGDHAYYIWCNNSVMGGAVKGSFKVTYQGVDPEGITIIIFSLLFIFICFEMLGLLLWTILHFIELNIDARDLILNVSSYFALFAVYILELRFVGDVFMSDFLLFLIEVGAITTVLIPIIGFVVSYIKQNTTKGDRN